MFLIQGAVNRQDDVRAIRDAQPLRRDLDALLGQHLDFLQQHVGIDDDPGSDQVERLLAQDSRRNQVQDRRLSVDDQGVPGVGTSLEAHHQVGFVGEAVDDLALALVSPLSTDNDDVRHA